MSISSSASDIVAPAEPRTAEWFAQEIHVHDAALKSYLTRAFPAARHEVEDVVQESYLRTWRASARQPVASAKAFLFKVARHVAVDLLRRNRVSPIDQVGNLGALSVIAEERGVAEAASMEEKVRLLVEGLATLPPRGREVVMLRKFKGLSQKEVGLRLGISEKTVDEHLYRGVKKLGKYLRERGVTSHYDR